jgi:transglutaminase-like putative cysteine protease
MLAIKVALRLAGFERTVRWVRATSGMSVRSIEVDCAHIDAIARAVAAAGAFYPGRALCLEQSLVLYWCLRRRGVEAELRIGVQPRPFAAHAWVEYRGAPVNDYPEHLASYVPFSEVVS